MCHDVQQCSECELCMECHVVNADLCQGCGKVMGECTSSLCCEECDLCCDCSQWDCLRPKCVECGRAVNEENPCPHCHQCESCRRVNQMPCCVVGGLGKMRCRLCFEWQYGTCKNCDQCWECRSRKSVIDERCRTCHERYLDDIKPKVIHAIPQLNADTVSHIFTFLTHQ